MNQAISLTASIQHLIINVTCKILPKPGATPGFAGGPLLRALHQTSHCLSVPAASAFLRHILGQA